MDRVEKMLNTDGLRLCSQSLREHRGSFDMGRYFQSDGTACCPIAILASRPDLLRVRGLPVQGGEEQLTLLWPRIRKMLGGTQEEFAHVFGPDGCGGARSQEEALAYLEDLISNGGEVLDLGWERVPTR